MKHAVWKRCLALVLGASLFAGAGTCAAKERLVVDWTPNVYSISTEDNGLLESPGVKEKIRQALTAKLKSLQAQKKLPFEVKFSNDLQVSGIQDDYSDVTPIGLMPIVLLDDAFTTHYHAADQDIYKSIVTSCMGMAVCSAGANGEGWRILTVIPLNEKKVLGADIQNLITTPITEQQLADVYADITVQMIEKRLDFSSAKKVLKDWEEKQETPETYQVADVGISSKKAQQVFHVHGIEIRNIIANFYTEAFQKKTGKVVLPPGIAAPYQKDVTSNLYSMQIRSDDGTMDLAMAAPMHEINLDFSGANWQEVQRKDASDVRSDVAYKAWLTEKSDLRPERTETGYAVQMYLKDKGKGNAVDVDAKDIYTQILIDLATKMGKQEK